MEQLARQTGRKRRFPVWQMLGAGSITWDRKHHSGLQVEVIVVSSVLDMLSGDSREQPNGDMQQRVKYMSTDLRKEVKYWYTHGIWSHKTENTAQGQYKEGSTVGILGNFNSNSGKCGSIEGEGRSEGEKKNQNSTNWKKKVSRRRVPLMVDW